MRVNKYNTKKQFVLKEKKLEKKHYRIIICLLIFGVIYYFIQPKTIGHDIRYSIYIFWLPTIIGMIALGFYRRQFLINLFATNKGIILRSFLVVFYLIQGLFISYLSFGQIAKVSWDYYNFKTVKENTENTFECPITKFWIGKNPCIYFTFNGRQESIIMNYKSIKDYAQKENNYKLTIKATKGVWNFYTLNNWTIERK